MKVASIEFENEEQLTALKAFAKAMKMKFIGLSDFSEKLEERRLLESIAKGYAESLAIGEGKIQPKTIEQLLNEL